MIFKIIYKNLQENNILTKMIHLKLYKYLYTVYLYSTSSIIFKPTVHNYLLLNMYNVRDECDGYMPWIIQKIEENNYLVYSNKWNILISSTS